MVIFDSSKRFAMTDLVVDTGTSTYAAPAGITGPDVGAAVATGPNPARSLDVMEPKIPLPWPDQQPKYTHT